MVLVLWRVVLGAASVNVLVQVKHVGVVGDRVAEHRESGRNIDTTAGSAV